MRVSTLSSPDLAAGVVAVVMAGTAVAAARKAPAEACSGHAAHKVNANMDEIRRKRY